MNTIKNINWHIFIPSILAVLFLLFLVIELRAAAIRIVFPILIFAIACFISYCVYASFKTISSDSTPIDKDKKDEESSD